MAKRAALALCLHQLWGMQSYLSILFSAQEDGQDLPNVHWSPVWSFQMGLMFIQSRHLLSNFSVPRAVCCALRACLKWIITTTIWNRECYHHPDFTDGNTETLGPKSPAQGPLASEGTDPNPCWRDSRDWNLTVIQCASPWISYRSCLAGFFKFYLPSWRTFRSPWTITGNPTLYSKMNYIQLDKDLIKAQAIIW